MAVVIGVTIFYIYTFISITQQTYVPLALQCEGCDGIYEKPNNPCTSDSSCSGLGKCDTTTGLCTCHSMYEGQKCDKRYGITMCPDESGWWRDVPSASCYRLFSTERLSWTHAHQQCRGYRGGNLATVWQKHVTDDIVRAIMAANLGEDEGVWLGLLAGRRQEAGDSSKYRWSDWSLSAHREWLTGYPTAEDDGGCSGPFMNRSQGSCVMLSLCSAGYWFNTDCHRLAYYVCQVPSRDSAETTRQDPDSTQTTCFNPDSTETPCPDTTALGGQLDSRPSCRAGWVAIGPACYVAVKEAHDFTSANNICGMLHDGAHLVSTGTTKELDDVGELIVKKHVMSDSGSEREDSAWIGLRRGKDKQWRWMDNNPSAHRDWAPNNPKGYDNLDGERVPSDCAVVRKSTEVGYKLVSRACDAKHRFICKYTHTDPSKNSCPDGWHKAGSTGVCHYYERGRKLTAAAAKEFCEASGSHLAEIREVSWFQQAIDGMSQETFVWMGAGPSGSGPCGGASIVTEKWNTKINCNERHKFICQTGCPLKDWFEYGSYCYRHFPLSPSMGVPYDKAEQVCREQEGAQVASIYSFEDWQFVNNLVSCKVAGQAKTCEANTGSTWLGQWARRGDEYMWSDGTPLDNTRGEAKGNGSCASFIVGAFHIGKNTDDCSKGMGFICKKPANTIPPLHRNVQRLVSYIGCYPLDDGDGFVKAPGLSGAVTPDECVNLCHRAKYEYAALYNGGVQCKCSNRYGEGGYVGEMIPPKKRWLVRAKIGKDDRCYHQCKANYALTCGGKRHYDVYRTKYHCPTDKSFYFNGYCYGYRVFINVPGKPAPDFSMLKTYCQTEVNLTDATPTVPRSVGENVFIRDLLWREGSDDLAAKYNWIGLSKKSNRTAFTGLDGAEMSENDAVFQRLVDREHQPFNYSINNYQVCVVADKDTGRWVYSSCGQRWAGVVCKVLDKAGKKCFDQWADYSAIPVAELKIRSNSLNPRSDGIWVLGTFKNLNRNQAREMCEKMCKADLHCHIYIAISNIWRYVEIRNRCFGVTKKGLKNFGRKTNIPLFDSGMSRLCH